MNFQVKPKIKIKRLRPPPDSAPTVIQSNRRSRIRAKEAPSRVDRTFYKQTLAECLSFAYGS